MARRTNMIKALVIWLCVCGALASPAGFGVFDDVENDAEIIEAVEPLRGTGNLLEKRVPVIRLTIPAGYLGLYGHKNHAERNQLPRDPIYLPGVSNLEEKAIPEAVIRSSMRYPQRYPKSRVELVDD